jgi:hypothetical protein
MYLHFFPCSRGCIYLDPKISNMLSCVYLPFIYIVSLSHMTDSPQKTPLDLRSRAMFAFNTGLSHAHNHPLPHTECCSATSLASSTSYEASTSLVTVPFPLLPTIPRTSFSSLTTVLQLLVKANNYAWWTFTPPNRSTMMSFKQ